MKFLYLLVLCVLLIGCSQSNTSENVTNEGGGVGNKVVDDSIGVVSAPVVSTDVDTKISTAVSIKSKIENKTICVAEWICLSAKTKIYREANCSFTLRQDCKFGCKNNTCAAAPVCTSGWNCDGNHYRGYRLESCEFEKKEKCEFGCKDAVCLNEQVVNTTAIAKEQGSAEVAKPVLSTISLGETVVIENHNVSIYTMTNEQVMLSVDGRKSKLIKEGDSYTREDLTIVVGEILFQSYNNGLKQISYSVK